MKRCNFGIQTYHTRKQYWKEHWNIICTLIIMLLTSLVVNFQLNIYKKLKNSSYTLFPAYRLQNFNRNSLKPFSNINSFMFWDNRTWNYLYRSIFKIFLVSCEYRFHPPIAEKRSWNEQKQSFKSIPVRFDVITFHQGLMDTKRRA